MNGYPEMAGRPGFDQWGRAIPHTSWAMPNNAVLLQRLFGQAEWDRLLESAGQARTTGEGFQLDGDALEAARERGLDLEQTRIVILAEAFKAFVDSLDPRHR